MRKSEKDNIAIDIRRIKQLGREKARRNSSQCALAELIPMLAQIGFLALTLKLQNRTALFVLVIAAIAIGILFEIGQTDFYMENSKGNASWKRILRPFSITGLGMMETILMKYVIIMIHGLLLIVPGVIQGYSYGMVNYIAVSDPTYEWARALNDSEKIMNGHKKEYFRFRLSFYPLFIISLLTFGLMYVLYVGPYYHQSKIEFLKNVQEDT